MRSLWGVYVPAGAEEFPGPIALRKQLRRCGCGQMTFLSLPCRNCGAQRNEPAFRWARRKAWTRRIGRWVLAAVYLLVAGWAAFQIWVPLAWLTAVGTAAALAADLIRSTPDGDSCFWLFHDRAGGKKTLADAARIEALTDAYDGDLRRLEQMLERDPESAGRVFYMAQDLAQVFHNRRVSALLAACLAKLSISEGICVDLDQICAWLEPEDVSPEVLLKLGECARFTCLPAGGPTARFVGRFCAFRIQEAMKQDTLTGYAPIWRVPDPNRPSRISLRRAVGSKRERAALSALWNLAAVYLTPQTPGGPAPSEHSSGTAANGTPEGAAYYADAWRRYTRQSSTAPTFQEIEKLLNDKLGASLKKQWGKPGRVGQDCP